MLYIKRKRRQKIIVGEVTITVDEVRGNLVRLGIENPKGVPIKVLDSVEKMLESDLQARPESAQ